MGELRALGRVVTLAGALILAGEGARGEAPPATAKVDAGATAAAAPSAARPTRAWKQLRSAAATASSFLQNDWNAFEENYHPSYVLDENPATAWVEGAEGFGKGETLTIPLSPVARARALRLRVWNGYQKSMHLWTKNAMPRRVRFSVANATHKKVLTEERELARVLGPQDVILELPPGSGVASVTLEIVSVYEGEKYDDTCISDILVDVDADVKYNAVAETAKHASLLAWIGERKATAAYFASKPAEFPFAFTKYTEARSTIDKADFKRRFSQRDVLAGTLGAERFRAGARSLRALPDGLANEFVHVDDFAGLVKLAGVALVATTEATAAHRTFDEGLRQIWTSSARVARDATDKSVRVLAFDIKDVYTERTSSTLNRDLLLVFDDKGRVAAVYRKVMSHDDEPDGDDGEPWYDEVTKTDELWTFTYDAAGKIQSLECVSLPRHHRTYDDKKTKVLEDKRATRVVYTGLPDKSS